MTETHSEATNATSISTPFGTVSAYAVPSGQGPAIRLQLEARDGSPARKLAQLEYVEAEDDVPEPHFTCRVWNDSRESAGVSSYIYVDGPAAETDRTDGAGTDGPETSRSIFEAMDADSRHRYALSVARQLIRKVRPSYELDRAYVEKQGFHPDDWYLWSAACPAVQDGCRKWSVWTLNLSTGTLQLGHYDLAAADVAEVLNNKRG